MDTDQLKHLIEDAAADVFDLPRPGLRFTVDRVEASDPGHAHIRVWANLYFSPEGSPFYLGYSAFFCHPDVARQIGERVGRVLNLKGAPRIEFVGGVREIGTSAIEFVNRRDQARHPMRRRGSYEVPK
jgi:hypothetical protein